MYKHTVRILFTQTLGLPSTYGLALLYPFRLGVFLVQFFVLVISSLYNLIPLIVWDVQSCFEASPVLTPSSTNQQWAYSLTHTASHL